MQTIGTKFGGIPWSGADSAGGLGRDAHGGAASGDLIHTPGRYRVAFGPVSGMLHALFILVFMAVAAPLAADIPLAALVGVLAVVAWTMIEKPAIAALVHSGWGEATVLATPFARIIFRDLTEAMVGFALGSVLFIHRLSEVTAVTSHSPFVWEDEPDPARPRGNDARAAAANPEAGVDRVTGVLFSVRPP